jgi:hypothetical protein
MSIKYKRMVERFNPSKLYGIAFEVHPKGKSLIILMGRTQIVFYTGPMK